MDCLPVEALGDFSSPRWNRIRRTGLTKESERRACLAEKES
jgi:hypothetical protein